MKVVVLGFVVPVSVCVRGMSCLGLYVCSHVRVRRSIILVVIFCCIFVRGSFFLYFVCCTLDYFILPVRQADVAFLTLFIGISGGKAWFISFGTN